jgi:alpha-tubulin suppressor-like RCC1 family protein
MEVAALTRSTSSSTIAIGPEATRRRVGALAQFRPGRSTVGASTIVGRLQQARTWTTRIAGHFARAMRIGGVAAIVVGAVVAATAGGPVDATPAMPGAGLQPLTPARLLDTRTGTQTVDNRYVGTGPVGAGGSLDVQVAGRGGVPATGVAAVVLNVTVTAPTATTFVTVWPTGGARPNASTLNAVEGQTAANSIIVGVGDNGSVSLYNDAGNSFLIADVAGWFAAGGGFAPTTPARLLDTRTGGGTIDGTGAGIGAVGTNSAIALRVTGRGGVPADGVAAVALNVTATEPTATSYVTVWPTGAARPNASNLNVTAGATVANLVVVGAGAGGEVSLYNESGQTDLLVDVVGWFSVGGSYQPLTPARIADFRTGGSTADGQFSGNVVLAPGESRPIKVASRVGVPAAAVAAVVLNVTITDPTATSFITVWPGGIARPNASSLNVRAGQTVANAVVVKVGSNGEVNVFNESGQSRLIIDIEGWFGTVAQQQLALDVGTGPFAHACAIGRDSNTWCWGDDSVGQTGQPAGSSGDAPVIVADTTGSASIATGLAHSCAVTAGHAVSCWGANGSGQLGDGGTTSRSTPAAVPALADAVAVVAGANHTCALLADGSVWCWGANGSGQLGNSSGGSPSPLPVAGLGGAVAITAGGDHTCALLTTGSVRCWGGNGSGQLGSGSTTSSATPVDPGLTGVTAISAGNLHTCAALADGTARCWGANPDGRLGTGDTAGHATPTAVVGLTGVRGIAAGPTRSCATTAIGYAFCWGDNTGRSLGNGSNDASSATPVPVYGISTAAGVAVGATSSCATLTDGTARCWGLNLNGQLGDGTEAPSGSPVAVRIA